MRNKIKTDKFIQRSIKVHGEKYDYSLVDYINAKTKAKIICPSHGIFEQEANSHLLGMGCSVCSGTKKSTNHDFTQKAIKVHGDKYDYRLVEYVNNKTKVNIICEEHGIFEQSPSKHLNGRNCPTCANICRGLKKKSNIYDFVEKAIKVHGYKYDYNLSEYLNTTYKIEIICKTCYNIFSQSPASHLKGAGCRICNLKLSNTHDFIKKIY